MAHGGQYDFKTDNWAIGVLTYELLVGKAPFETKSRGMTLDGIKKGEVQFPSFLSEDSRDFINKLLKNNPDVRMELGEANQHPFIKKYEKAK
jgi:aurora kinase